MSRGVQAPTKWKAEHHSPEASPAGGLAAPRPRGRPAASPAQKAAKEAAREAAKDDARKAATDDAPKLMGTVRA